MNERKILARGTALVDPRAAVERLRSFQLAEPLLYVLEIVRAAVAGGATAVDLYNDADDLVLTFDGAAPSADDLAHLLDHLFSTSNPRLRLLAIAVNTALGFGPRHVDLYTTHDAPPGQCHRVRFTAGVSHDPAARVPAALEQARVELVARPADLPTEGLRVHLRESFGLPVMREWFATDPAETVLLREHLVALPIPLRRDGTPLATGFSPAALVSVDLDLGADLRGSLHLLGPAHPHRLALSELGVILEQRPLTTTGDGAAPLRLHLDARALPTNASRSQVDLSGGLQHALRRAWNLHLPTLLDATRARLDDPALPADERIALHESLLRWMHHDLGESWITAVVDAPPDDTDLGHTSAAAHRALLAWPLVPTAGGALVSLDSLIARLAISGRRPSLVWNGPEPVAADLAPWLIDVLWCPPKRPHLEALLRPLRLASALPAIRSAKEAQERKSRFLGLTPREPRLGPVDDTVLRVVFGEDPTDDQPTLPSPLADLRGELRLRSEGLDAPGILQVTVFYEQRPLAVEKLDTAAVPAEVTLEGGGLRAHPWFQGVERDEALAAALRSVKSVLAEALAVLADEFAGTMSVADPRRRWFGPALDALSRDERNAMARAAFESLRVTVPDVPSAARDLARDLLDRHPGLAELPLWPTSAPGVLLSTRELRALGDPRDGAVLYSTAARGPRADGRPVLLPDAAMLRVLPTLLHPSSSLVDVTAALPARSTENPRLLASRARGAVPWLVVASAHARVAVAPSPEARSSLTLAHSGLVLDVREPRVRFGPLQLVVEDDRLVPLAGKPAALPASIPTDLADLVAAAELTLACKIALAWRGREDARDELDSSDDALTAAPARRLLLGALAYTAEHPDAVPLRPLREALEDAPLIPVRAANGAVLDLTPRSLREPIAALPTPVLPYLAEAPDDLAGEDFPALIVPDREHRALIEGAFAVKLRSAHEQLPSLRLARTRRLARAQLAAQARVRADDLAAFATASPMRSLAQHALGALHAAAAREPASARIEVVVDDAVAFVIAGEALAFPVVGRLAVDGDVGLTGPLDGFTSAGAKDFNSLLLALVPTLIEAALDEDATPAEGVAALCLRWAAQIGVAGLAAHLVLLARIRKAPLWRGPDGERLSLATLTLVSPRAGWCLPRAAPWIALAPGDDPDLAAVVLDHPSKAAGLAALVGELALDRGEEIDALQRRRALRLSGGAKIKLPGEAAHAALSVRIEALAPKLGFGELRFIEGEAALTLRVHAPGSNARVLTLPAPFAMAVALASADLDPKDVDRSVLKLELSTRLLEVARSQLVAVAASSEALPRWADAALRWALLTTRGLTGGALGRAVFADTEGKPMSLADLHAQELTQRAVGYCTYDPGEACALPEAGARAAVLSTREAGWLQTLRKGRDLTAAVKLAQRALAWDRSPPAAQIAAPAEARVGLRVAITLKEGLEGEVCWLNSDAPRSSAVTWFRGRRRLGEGPIELPWPARLALEVPTLTPDATRTGPVEDLALAQARQRAIDVAMATLNGLLGPRAGEAPLGAVPAHERKSPAWRGGTAVAVGWFWLRPDGEPGELEMMAGEQRVTMRPGAGGFAAPIEGRLWLARGADAPGASRDGLLDELVAWAWRRLLDVWADAKEANPDDDAQLVHLTRAAVAGVFAGAALRNVARTLRLPGTRTTLQQVQTAQKEGRALVVVPAGDARLQKAYFVADVEAPWMTVLREAGMLASDTATEVATARAVPTATATKAAPTRAAEPARREEPRREEPAPKAKASAARAEAWPWAARVEGELRAWGLPAELLHTLEPTDAARGARDAMVDYRKSAGTALVAVRHPVVARWLTGDPRRGATLLAMAVYGAINREREEVGATEECAAMDAVLAGLAARE